MKSQLIIQSWNSQPAEPKHQRLMEAMLNFGSWGIVTPDYPTYKYKSGIATTISLSKFLNKGITGDVDYVNRGDSRLETDSIGLYFTPEKQPYKELFQFLPAFITTFDAYQIYLCRQDLTSIQSHTSPNVNSTKRLFYIQPVHFFLDDMAQKSFGLTAREIYDRLAPAPEVEHVELLHGGILIVNSTNILSVEEQAECSRTVRRLLGLTPDVEMPAKASLNSAESPQS
jgi:hypothetical protein